MPHLTAAGYLYHSSYWNMDKNHPSLRNLQVREHRSTGLFLSSHRLQKASLEPNQPRNLIGPTAHELWSVTKILPINVWLVTKIDSKQALGDLTKDHLAAHDQANRVWIDTFCPLPSPYKLIMHRSCAPSPPWAPLASKWCGQLRWGTATTSSIPI